MKKQKRVLNGVQKAGKNILAVGCVFLLLGLVCAVTGLGPPLAVPVFLSSSILLNSAGITMLTYKK